VSLQIAIKPQRPPGSDPCQAIQRRATVHPVAEARCVAEYEMTTSLVSVHGIFDLLVHFFDWMNIIAEAVVSVE
jgi:hypothetical protein